MDIEIQTLSVSMKCTASDNAERTPRSLYIFHNQYVQNFAELGVIGFLLLLVILFINTKNAFATKDFIHIAFAILMISLFLTESFLWRQRGVLFFMLFYSLRYKSRYIPT